MLEIIDVGVPDVAVAGGEIGGVITIAEGTDTLRRWTG